MSSQTALYRTARRDSNPHIPWDSGFQNRVCQFRHAHNTGAPSDPISPYCIKTLYPHAAEAEPNRGIRATQR